MSEHTTAAASEREQEQLLIADLLATFPGLFARPLREFGRAWSNAVGVWTGGPANMPDGYPIFDDGCYLLDVYNGRVHEGFERWLALRGWVIEDYDGAVFHITPADDGADMVLDSAAAEGSPA